MPESIHPALNWINLTPEEGNFHFGYYDRCPWNADDRLHLAMKIPQQDRLPEPGETATVGIIDREERQFRPLTETEAWGHQVGCLNVWRGSEPGIILFNNYIQDGDQWKPVLSRHHIENGPDGEYEGHHYAISHNGKYASSFDYGRLPRRGYSFARSPLPVDTYLPDNIDEDGLFIIDLDSRKRKLIVSYKELLDLHPRPYDLDGRYFWLNQGCFNCDDTRILFIFRYTDSVVVENAAWFTDQYTVCTDGSDLMISLDYQHWKGVSHEIWGRTPREILVDADWCGRGHQYIVYDESIQPPVGRRISDGQGSMGHLNFSPDGKWLAADTYRDGNGIQHLALVKVETGECIEIGQFKHATTAPIDMRCDLHPRWSHDSRWLTIDSIHLGERNIFMLDVQQAEGLFK